MAASTADVDCSDLSAFMTRLSIIRRADDAIILKLNEELPTRSFPDSQKSKQICDKLRRGLDELAVSRKELIVRCTAEIKEKMTAAGDDVSKLRPLRTLFRSIRGEADVEQIVLERSHKAVHERCDRLFPPTP